MIQLQKVMCDDLKSIRLDYLKALPVFQDYFMEINVEYSDCFGLYFEKKQVGFITRYSDNILTSLYISDHCLNKFTGQFREVLYQLGMVSIYCLSFDHLLMNLCL